MERRIRVDPSCGHASATTGVSCARYDQLVEVAPFKMWPEAQRKPAQKEWRFLICPVRVRTAGLSQTVPISLRNRPPFPGPGAALVAAAKDSLSQPQRATEDAPAIENSSLLIAGFESDSSVECTAPD
jgi:hypothetical protein